MLNATLPTQQHTAKPAETFGRIARTFAANDDRWTTKSSDAAQAVECNEAEALAMHAWATSGFGDPVISLAPVLVSIPAQAPRAPRQSSVIRAVAQIFATVRGVVIALADRFRRHSEAHATYVALRNLDASTLRDLGIDRCEIRSVANEISNGLSPTRIRTMRADGIELPKASFLSLTH